MTRHQYRFLHLFLRYHITGKPVVSPQNVGCFPRLSVGWVPLALFCHLVLTSDYKNYMMFSNSPSGVSVNNVHGGTLRECYQIYNRNNATLTAFSWTFLYYHQKKKQFYNYTAGCKINTITCQVQVTNLISLESMARHLPDNQSCKMYTYMSSKKREKKCTQGLSSLQTCNTYSSCTSTNKFSSRVHILHLRTCLKASASQS